VLDMHQRPEAIPLDLENPVWIGKRLASAAKGHWLELREGHQN